MRIQTVEARGEEALLPADDGRSRGPKSQLDGAEGRPFGQHQDKPGPKYVSSGQRTGLRDATEFQLLVFTEHDVVAGHTHLDVNKGSNVYSATGH